MNQLPAEPVHDLIDNQQRLYLEQTHEFLGRAESARFALGYLFLPGLLPLVESLSDLKETRLLVGNTSTQETLDQLAVGLQDSEEVQSLIESWRFPKRPLVKQMEVELCDSFRLSLSQLEQSDETEQAILKLIELLEEKQLQVRMYYKGRLQARTGIFNYQPAIAEQSGTPGVGLVGSTNLTLAEFQDQTELNIVARGAENHAELIRWFDDLWKKSREISQGLLQELQQCWAAIQVRPYDIYLKSLYTLIRDRLEESDVSSSLWDDDINQKLADFQRVAVEQAVQIILDYGGAFVSDVVGLGKSFVGAAIVKHFERSYRTRALIICPAPLVDMWERYNEVYELNAKVLSMGKLRENLQNEEGSLLESELYQNRDFVLIDESHHFRHSNTQRYQLLEPFLSDGKRCCFLTATPRNKSAWDVYHQLKLFHPEERTDIPVSPPILKDYFKGVEQGNYQLNELLANILIRRTRRDIIRWYGYDSETDERIDPQNFEDYRTRQKKAYVIVGGEKQYFPARNLETIEYSIDDAYQGLYQQVRQMIGSASRIEADSDESEELTYARYGLWNYVRPELQYEEPYHSIQRAGANLRGLLRVLLFKRFESSVQAFRETIARLLRNQRRFLQAIEEGMVPAGDEAQDLLNDPYETETQDFLDQMRAISGHYDITGFDVPLLTRHLKHDIAVLERILAIVAPITAENDAKLQTLLARLSSSPLSEGKCLIFTQYTDTAQYLYKNLKEATSRDDIAVVFGNDRSRLSTIGRFAPVANPEYRQKSKDPELNLLIATDSLSEGLNLQDCDKIINYDLHWNPVRLIQRFGRIDRIGSSHEEIHGFNFLPETGIEQQLGLQRVLQNRIREIHESIGEDVAILDPGEQLNENAMYAIYEQSGNALDEFEAESGPDFDLNEAMEMFRQMRQDDPEEYERIASLPDGIRSAMIAGQEAVFVHCKAGKYQQLYLADKDGEIISQDLLNVLSRIRCDPETEAQPIPEGHNSAVMKVKQHFDQEASQRLADRHHTVSQSQGQRYVLKELRQLFSAAESEEKKARLQTLDSAFRNPLSTALNRELNRLRKNQVSGEALQSALVDLYNHHDLRRRSRENTASQNQQFTPTLVCSESFR